MKIKNFLFSLLTSTTTLYPLSIVSCANLENKTIKENYEKEVEESFKHIVTQDSILKLDSILFSKIIKNDNRITKDLIEKNIVINENSFLNQELKKINKLEELKNNLVNEIFESYKKEYENKIEKCGNWFRSHFWMAIGRKMISTTCCLLSSFWWAAQVAPAIILFVKNLDGVTLAETLSSFSFNVPSFFIDMMKKGIINILNFKKSTNCKWSFVVWNPTGYLVFV